MAENKAVPKSVLVQGKQVNVTKDKKGRPVTEIADPRKPIKTSPFDELLPATDEWITKYGGSDVSIVAYNVHLLLKEKNSAEKKDK